MTKYIFFLISVDFALLTMRVDTALQRLSLFLLFGPAISPGSFFGGGFGGSLDRLRLGSLSQRLSRLLRNDGMLLYREIPEDVGII